MAIEKVNNEGLTYEQLMAYMLSSNGQLTSDSETSVESGEFQNLAFQMMLTDYINSEKSGLTSNAQQLASNLANQNLANQVYGNTFTPGILQGTAAGTDLVNNNVLTNGGNEDENNILNNSIQNNNITNTAIQQNNPNYSSQLNNTGIINNAGNMTDNGYYNLPYNQTGKSLAEIIQQNNLGNVNLNNLNGLINTNTSANNGNSLNSLTASASARGIQSRFEGMRITDIPEATAENYIPGTEYLKKALQNISENYNLNPKVTENLVNQISGEAPSGVPQEIYNAVKSAAQKYNVNEKLILAIIKQESNFDTTCVSNAGAAGLMQIMPGNYAHLGITDPYDINQNIEGGTKLLREYLDRYNNDVELALMAYNGGPGTMQVRGVSSVSDLYKMPKETQHYVPKVMGYFNNGFTIND